MTAVTMVLLWRSHPGEDSLSLWALGSSLIAAGYMGIALRGWVPLFVSVALANSAITVGQACLLSGVNRLGGRKPVAWYNLFALAVFIMATLGYFAYVHSSTAVRMAIQFSVIGLIALLTAKRLLAMGEAASRITFRSVATLFAIYGASLLLRVALMPFDLPDQYLFAPNAIHSVVFLVMLLFYASLMYSFPALLYAKDLVRREATERALRDSDEAYRAILTTSLDGYWLVGPEGHLLDVNHRYADQSGYSREELLQMRVNDLEAVEDQEATAAHIRRILTEGHDQFETQHRRKDGSIWHVEVSVIYNANLGVKIFTFLRDITARKQAEEILRESEDRFRRLVDNSPVPMLVTSIPPALTIMLMNRRFTELFGYTRDEVRDTDSWWPLAYPDPAYRSEVRECWSAAIEAMVAAGADHVEPVKARICCRDGSVRVVEVGMALTGDRALVVFNDITELEAHRHGLEDLVASRTEQLAHAKEAAEAASRAKSVFLSNMSHELRTPLNAILGFSQLLAKDSGLSPSQHQDVKTINESGQQLFGIVNDVLEISRIESGRLMLMRQNFDLYDLLRIIENSVQLRAQHKGLRLHFEQAEGLPHKVNTDPAKVRQVLLNLLSNAIKYTRQGEVVLTAGYDIADGRAWLHFSVRDTGVGIAAEEMAHLFDPFFQTEFGTRQGEGTGLGLAICRQYADLLGGRVTASSTPGEGSVFRFDVPVALVDTVDIPATTFLPGETAGKRILVVEDNPANRDLLVKLLERAGYAVDTAANGRVAIEMLTSRQPDLILMDMRMPEMDGYAATRLIRAMPGAAAIPILALTAFAFEEDRRQILAAGCNDVLTKPIEAVRVLAMIQHYVGEAEANAGT